MRRDIALSVGLHVLAVVLMVVAPSLGGREMPLLGEVIRVDVLDWSQVAGQEMPAVEETEPEEMVQPSIPPPAEEPPEEIPISDPTTKQEAEIKPEPVVESVKEPDQAPPDKPTGDNRRPAEGDTGQQQIHSPVTGQGSALAGATVDSRSFNYPYWFTQAFNKILRNWRNPVATDGSIICVVYFQVMKSGRIIEARIEQSSGIGQFDDACLRAVNGSSPFPPLPRQFTDEIIGITLPFKYEPR
ncbi:MAG: TonB family protein [bacterium]